LDNDVFKSALKQMTRSKMSIIESPRIGRPQPLHGFGQIGTVGPEQNMIMVAHQYIGEYVGFKTCRHLTQTIQKGDSVFVVPEYVLLLIPT
jgi:hypothetical protein